jgi:PTS system mannose-specific IID component
VTFAERLAVFVRLHFLQCCWNFKGMQHFGCLTALRPALHRLYRDGEYIEAERRQGQFFNTHPYFAPICVGVVVKLEEELRSGSFTKPEMIPILKNRMSGPLAAVGDAYFWETLRPALSALAVFSVYLFGAGSDASIVILAGLLLAYILPVELIRWQGFDWGYVHGLAVVDLLKKRDFHGSMRRIRNIAALGLGAATVFFLAGDGSRVIPVETGLKALVLAALITLSTKKFSPTTMLYLTAAVGMAAGIWL